ncbi:SAM-dependent methyltransferase [Parasphingorhabdus pacifica]
MSYRIIGDGRAVRQVMRQDDVVDPADRPNSARMYDHYLGGRLNFAPDRRAAAELDAVWPHMPTFIRANRAFLRRAVRFLSEQGVDQFLDLGSGIPTEGNVHEVAHGINPEARVAYTDVDPTTVEYAHDLLAGASNVSISTSDIRRPSSVLTAPGVSGLLDFTRPLAVLAVAILPCIADDEEVGAVVNAYRDACPSGSYIVVAHSSPSTVTPEQFHRAHSIMRRELAPVRWRTPEQIAGLLHGYSLVDPGMVLVPEWRPGAEGGAGAIDPTAANTYGAVGYLASASYSL